MKKPIVIIWDIMLDQYHFGSVKRLNPESPNPLLHIDKIENRLWWAANVAANVASLGGQSHLIGNIGHDNNAQLITDLCLEHNIEFSPIHTKEQSITKVRFVEQTYNQQLLRADYEDAITLEEVQIPYILKRIEGINPEIILFSDYIKWLLSPNLIKQICTKFSDTKILVDTKPSRYNLYTNVYLFKPNFGEFAQLFNTQIHNSNEDIEKYGQEITLQYDANFVITRGKHGATMILKDWTIKHLQTHALTVFDVSWAWDTFFAGLWVYLAEWKALIDAIEFGNKASWIAVGKIGTSIIHRSEVK